MFRKISKTIQILTALIFSFGLITLPGQAMVSISPYNSNIKDPNEKNWFLFQAKPGESISDAFKINNSETEPTTLKITAKDFEITQEGQYTIIPDEKENKETGKWLSLDVSRSIVPAKSTVKIPFKLTIPKETKDGEYSAGLSVTEINTSQETVNIALRKGIRSYIAVGSDFKLDADVKALNIVDPSDSDFDSVLKSKGYAGRDNTLLSLKIKNNGNIFGVLNAKYSLKYDDGSVFEGKFSTEIAPSVGERTFYIITNQAYRVGNTEAILDYEITPQNIEAAKVKISNSKGILSDKINLTQTQWDNFSKAKQKAFASSLETVKIENPETKKSSLLENLIYIIFPSVLFLGIIGGVLVAEREIWLENKGKNKK